MNDLTKLQARFWSKVDTTGTCWLWTGSISKGYGHFQYTTRTTRSAHRVAYELAFGPIPGGLQIDHLCHNKACVHPDHLEAVTPAENIHRYHATNDYTYCPRGHPMTGDNVDRVWGGCRTCRRKRKRDRYREQMGVPESRWRGPYKGKP